MAPIPPRSNYAHLNRIEDPAVRAALKTILDRLGNTENLSSGIGTLTEPLTDDLDASGNRLTSVADPTAGKDAVNRDYMRIYVEAAITHALATTPTPTPTPTPTHTPVPIPTPPGVCYMTITGGQPGGVPGKNYRWFRGDFCGPDVPGMPAVPGGASDPIIVLSPFLDRYSLANQEIILAAHAARGYTHFLQWWPDSRDGNAQSIAQFVATQQMIYNGGAGMWPVITLYSKVYDGHNPDPAKNDALIAALLASGIQWVCCIGFEMDEFFDPGATIQATIDHVTGLLVPNVDCYVHFSEGITSWQQNGLGGNVFWNANVNKLEGILHQKTLAWDCPFWQSKLNDLQARFGTGASGWPTNNGFGRPFAIVAAEYSAAIRFNGSTNEAQATAMGQQAIATPGPNGALPPIGVKGFLNGGPGLGHGT